MSTSLYCSVEHSKLNFPQMKNTPLTSLRNPINNFRVRQEGRNNPRSFIIFLANSTNTIAKPYSLPSWLLSTRSSQSLWPSQDVTQSPLTTNSEIQITRQPTPNLPLPLEIREKILTCLLVGSYRQIDNLHDLSPEFQDLTHTPDEFFTGHLVQRSSFRPRPGPKRLLLRYRWKI